MLKHRLDLKLKGERDYLQGPDIYNETLAWLREHRSDVKDIDFAFHRLARRQLDIVVGEPPKDVEPMAVCTFTAGKVRERAFLIETDFHICDRHPYFEEQITRVIKIDLPQKKVSLQENVPFSDMEVWVSMTKALHFSLFPNLPGKWLFVRGRFSQFIGHSTSVDRTIVFSASFNNKLTRSEAIMDGNKTGEIYFSIV